MNFLCINDKSFLIFTTRSFYNAIDFRLFIMYNKYDK